MKIELNSAERLILLDALIHEPYVEKVQGPKTPKEVAMIYDALTKKMAIKEVEATTGKPTAAIDVLRKEVKFINFKLAEMNKKEKLAAADIVIDLERAIVYLEDL